MLIREMSDVHLEFGDLQVKPMPEDKDTVLVLAGDIGLVYNPTQLELLGRFLVGCSVQFRAVIYVLGNHEHYKYSYIKTYDTVRQMIADRGLDNVFLLERETKVIDDVAFIGATLWTNYDNNPTNAYIASRAMNDHRLIRTGSALDPYAQHFRPEDAKKEHDLSKQYVFEQVKAQKTAGNKTVVVVHHGVSYKSVHPKYAGSDVNSAFTSALDDYVLDAQPDVIFHGHTHECFDYMIGDTRVIVNPRGYVGYEYNDFNPELRIEI